MKELERSAWERKGKAGQHGKKTGRLCTAISRGPGVGLSTLSAAHSQHQSTASSSSLSDRGSHHFLLGISFISTLGGHVLKLSHRTEYEGSGDFPSLFLPPLANCPIPQHAHTYLHVCTHRVISGCLMLKDGSTGGKKQVEELCLAGAKCAKLSLAGMGSS